MKNSIREWIAFGLLACIWGSSFLWIKEALFEVSPLAVVAYRLLFGALTMLFILALTRQKLPRRARDWRCLLLLAPINLILPFLLISWGETRISSALAAVLNGTVPLFSMIIGHYTLREERMRGQSIFGLALGFLGVWIVVGHDLHVSSSFAGELAMLAAASCYAIGGLYARAKVRDLDPLGQSTAVLMISAAMMWLYIFISPVRVGFPSTATAWTSLLWLGCLGSAMAFSLYFFLLRAWGATRTSVVTYLFPAVGLILGLVFLHEKADRYMWIGTLTILLGIFVVNRRKGSRPAPSKVLEPKSLLGASCRQTAQDLA